MNWWLPRLLIAVGGVALGAMAGYAGGGLIQLPIAGATSGAALGLGLALTLDAWRGRRLLDWLRGAQETQAPRDTGFWGELGYRVERAVRSRERDLDAQREKLAQFLQAIDASPNGVLLLDANDQIEWCNAVAADHLGLDPVRDRHQRVTNLVRAPVFVACLQAADDAEPVTFSTPGRAETLSVLTRRYGEGQRLVITQDVTERLRADAMRRDFVANVSHEIRTPLTVLAGFVDTMRQLQLTEAERSRVLMLMKQQTDRMQTLVTDLLTLAQLEGSPRPPTDKWVSIDELMQRAQSDAAALADARLQLAFGDAGGAQVAGDAGELAGALGNLVTNAIRYTPDGGRITVSWQVRANGQAVLEVGDNGIGIAREHLPRLGQRFYRVDGSRSRDSGGTGLGLAIVKHAMQRHGGSLDIESEPGAGSRFRMVFPAVRVRPGVLAPAGNEPPVHNVPARR